jgi:hypothetical protein
MRRRAKTDRSDTAHDVIAQPCPSWLSSAAVVPARAEHDSRARAGGLPPDACAGAASTGKTWPPPRLVRGSLPATTRRSAASRELLTALPLGGRAVEILRAIAADEDAVFRQPRAGASEARLNVAPCEYVRSVPGGGGGGAAVDVVCVTLYLAGAEAAARTVPVARGASRRRNLSAPGAAVRAADSRRSTQPATVRSGPGLSPSIALASSLQQGVRHPRGGKRRGRDSNPRWGLSPILA